MHQANAEEEAAEAEYRAATLRRESLIETMRGLLPRCDEARRERAEFYQRMLKQHEASK